MAEPRGIRLNNPGLIRRSKERWQGLSEYQPDAEFFNFTGATWGIRAMARILIVYQDKRLAADGSSIDTVREIISRWAPLNENDTESYIDAVCQSTGFAPDQVLNMQDFDQLCPLVRAIIKHENGKQPYDNAVIARGLELAGVTSAAKPPARTRTIKAVAASGVGTTGLAIEPLVREATQNIQPLVEFSPYIRLVFVGLIVFGLVVVAYQKVRAYRVEMA